MYGRYRGPAVLAHAVTLKQMREGRLPDTQFSRLIAHSYSPYIGWGPLHQFWAVPVSMEGLGYNHFTVDRYDRHVPLELYGAAFVPGTYHGVVAPVDIAATLASMLRINRPSAAVGRVLTDAMRPEGPNSTRVRENEPPHAAKN